jgi:hypothetical protein
MLVRDRSDRAGSVKVWCLLCSKYTLLRNCLVNTDGPAFKAYYCEMCCANAGLREGMVVKHRMLADGEAAKMAGVDKPTPDGYISPSQGEQQQQAGGDGAGDGAEGV